MPRTEAEVVPLDPSSIDRPPGIEEDRIVVRMATDRDAEAIAAHFLRCFDDGWPFFEIDCPVADHVAWKMNSDPESASQQTVATLVDDDDFVISTAIWMRRPFWFRGAECVLLDVADLSVHPDWRLIKINQKRRDFCTERGFETQDLQMSWLANHPATRRSGLRQPTIGNRVLVFWKPASLRKLLLVPYRVAGWQHARGVVWAALRRRFRRPAVPRFAGRIEALDRFDARTDAVWAAARGQFDFAVARTHDYLNWRYADPRAGRFEIRAAIEGDEVIGYSVLKPWSDPAEVVDLLVRPDRLDALAALLEDASAQVRQPAVDLHCWLPGHHPYVETVRALGFYDSGRDPSLRYSAKKITIEELAFLEDPTARLHLTEGDSDFV